MSKYLIVNADDFGMCQSANAAVFDLFERGTLLSSTVMMPCPAAEDAVKWSSEHPEYAVGVHLTFTAEWGSYRWRPLTDSPSLIDKTGYMWHECPGVQLHAKNSEVRREIHAQVDRALELGLKPSHIDNHMGSLYGYSTGRLGLLPLTLAAVAEYGLPYRLYTKADRRVCVPGVPYPLFAASAKLTSKWVKKYGVIVPDYLMFPDWHRLEKNGVRSFDDYKRAILKIWTDLPDGVTETFVHPSVESDEIKGITARWQWRVWEYELFRDPDTRPYLEEHGVKMINYRDLVKLKEGEVL